ncbi:hypothetical protein F4777DRAFT_172034 [Nemania sp. FL0916]|nr:hypothetical protein F4777DRAFT_172034 [Nemania sp. FL0916]
MSTGLSCPPVQQRLPAEPAEPVKGTGLSALDLTIRPISELVARAGRPLLARLGSAIPQWGFGNMTKPTNLGAPIPINTLSNGSGTSSQKSFGIPSSSRPIPSNPPPAKRQKRDESDVTSPHSHSTFALIDTPAPSPRKASSETTSPAGSQNSIVPTISASVAEYRGVDRWTKSKKRRKRSSSTFPIQGEDVKTREPRLNTTPKGNEDVSDDEIDLISPQKAQEDLNRKRKRPEMQTERRPISEFSDRFKGTGHITRPDIREKFSKVIDKAERNGPRRDPDLSPDELATSPELGAAKRPAKRSRNLSPSLSRRGQIKVTDFSSASTAASTASRPATAQMDAQLVNQQKKEAEIVIGNGLQILRGVSGQCRYEADYEGDPDCCFLSLDEVGHTLQPVDQDANVLEPYAYLTLNLEKSMTIVHAKDDEDCYVVAIRSSQVVLSNGAGPRLVIEFASKRDFDKLFQWAAIYRRKFGFEIIDCPKAKLEKEFKEMMTRAKIHRIVRDDDIVADDIKVIQHNYNGRVAQLQANNNDVPESRTRSRIRDAMKDSTPKADDNGVVQSRGDPLALAQRRPRTTYSRLAYSSPEVIEPEPEGWTSLHPDWKKQWRNSLVYPDTGKNRATIDKDDIPRLDEGQFLNDNIIIFYLRYLQKNLDDSNQALSKRIYFHNTFFYDKLKPTKSGQGINYDSVKTWTSKVDLFSKDYIVVPINEYAHWYVAIICNAPQLLPSSKSHDRADMAERSTIAVPDDEVVQEISCASPQNEKSEDLLGGESVGRAEEVVDRLRRMSIDSPSGLSGEAKQDPGDKAEEIVDAAPAKSAQEVCVIQDSDKPEADKLEAGKPELEVEHIVTTSSPQSRKKMGKRQSVPIRKYDPSQPRIITLDSLGAPHSPTCGYLKQYLVAELRDKKGIEIPLPKAMGTTAKDVPEQTNHCDCGLFLLGYIQHFLLDPDEFVKSLLQRDSKISWQLNPSKLRTGIRDLIFDLQKEQQKAEDLIRERKRQFKRSKLSKLAQEEGSSNPAPISSLTKVSHTSSTSNPKIPSSCDADASEEKSLPVSTNSGPPSSESDDMVPIAVTDPERLLDRRSGADHAAITMQQPTQDDNSKVARQAEISTFSNVQEQEANPRSDVYMDGLPPTSEQILDPKAFGLVSSRLSISPARRHTSASFSPSSEAEAGTRLQNNFLQPLASGTSSSKSSRGATPLGLVVVDDSSQSKDGEDEVVQSTPKQRSRPSSKQAMLQLPTTDIHKHSPRQDGETGGSRRQTGQQSAYFAIRKEGETITSAKLHSSPGNDVIDLSDE